MRTSTSLGLSILSTLILGCAFLLAVDAIRALQQPLDSDKAQSFAVNAGDSLGQISKRLAKQGHLSYARDARYLSLAGRLSGKASGIHIGEYDLKAHDTPWALLTAMADGDVIQHNFTIVEGWNIRQLLAALRNAESIKQSEPALTAKSLAKELELEAPIAEGWFYPNTYQYPRGASDISILRRAYAAMREVLETEWEQRDPDVPYDSPYEALIMASIVEKETAVPEERKQIAGVFVRRLEKGMRLQTDPTVIYGIGAKYDGNIRRRDLLTDTPYNTYVRAGLPPTPIAMPGKAAINAALQPADGSALYFVSRGDGSHVFSDDLASHNEAVRKYQLGKKPAKSGNKEAAGDEAKTDKPDSQKKTAKP